MGVSAKQNIGTSNEKTGFITCGHGYTSGNAVYYGTSIYLGNVIKSVKNTVADAAFIQSAQSPSPNNRYGHRISYQGNVIKGEEIYVEGATGGSQKSSVTATGVTIIYEDENGVEQKRKNTFSYNSIGYKGNSGAAIISKYNGEYAVGGIQSSAMVPNTYTECFATQWNNVKSQLNITLSYW